MLDPEKGSDADHLIAAVQELHNSRDEKSARSKSTSTTTPCFGKPVNVYSVCALKQGLEFPDRDNRRGDEQLVSVMTSVFNQLPTIDFGQAGMPECLATTLYFISKRRTAECES